MATQAITKKEAESAIAAQERRKANEKAGKLKLSMTMAMGGGCAARGLLKAKTGIYNYQAGGFAFADLAMLGLGGWMGLKNKGKSGALGMGIFFAGLAPIAEGLGAKVADGLPSLGG